MGLFGLACTALSTYIWSATVYDVYKPLSQNLAQAAPSFNPSAIVSTLQRAIFSREAQSEQPPSARRGRRRKHLTLAEAQREELRDALKVFVIWLLLKGCEPAFDYTFGYVMPFYTLVKAIVLLVLARFRVQLSKHAFDSFVVPLGKPNTPLINATAFTALILPTLRFLLSLPFAHLSMAIKNAVLPYLASWTDSQQPSSSSESLTTVAADASQRVPPPNKSDARKVSSTLSVRRDDRSQGGSSGGGGSAFRTLKHQRSVESLQSRPRYASSSVSDIRARSVSSRTAPIDQRTINQLAELPSVPRNIPSGSISSASTRIMPTFAHIPSSYSRHDIVPPPSDKPVAFLPTMSSPRMPGSLSGSPEVRSNVEVQPSGSPVPTFAIGAAMLATPADVVNAQEEGRQTNSAVADTAPSDIDATPKKARKSARSSVKGTPRAKRKADEDVADVEDDAAKATASPPKQRKRSQANGAVDEDVKSSAKSRLPVSQSRRNVRANKDGEPAETNAKTNRRTAGETTRRTGGRAKKDVATK